MSIRFLPAAGSDHEGTSVGLLSGHVCRVYAVSPVDGKPGTEIPVKFHKAAVAAGCSIVGIEEPTIEAAKNDKQTLLVAAIERIIEADNPESLDANGRPKLAFLKKEAGMGVTKSEADAAWAEFVKSLEEDE